MINSLSGYLYTQSGVIKIWKRIFYKISENIIIGYTTENGREISRNDLKQCKIFENNDKPNSFILETNQKTIALKAENKSEYDIWFKTIQDIINSEDIEDEKLRRKVSLEDFSFIKVIGEGTFGKVTLVKFNENGKLYALKSMKKDKLTKEGIVQKVFSEREILFKNKNPFLVSAHFTFQTETKVFIVLDYVPGGELLQRLKEEGLFSEKRTQLYAAEILLGIEHLHKHGIIYRDLKPENILVDEEGHLKITDFGFAKNIFESEGQTTGTFCGTIEYLAPEVLRQKPYTKSVDWWAFGIIVYEMLCGTSPFKGENQQKIMESILFDEIEYPSFLNSTEIDLIHGLLERNSSKRLGSGNSDSEEIKAHPFFNSINFDDVLNKKTRPQWVPKIVNPVDTSNFDQKFTELPVTSFDDTTLITGSAQQAFADFTYDDQEQPVIA